MPEKETKPADKRIAWFREARDVGSWFLVFIVLALGGWVYMEDNREWRTEQLMIQRERLQVEMRRAQTDASRATGIGDIVRAVEQNNRVFAALTAAIDKDGKQDTDVMVRLSEAIEEGARSRRELKDGIIKALVRP
ncbi:unnamed protein product [marine sediment metagenome]|uniref:Uncharacterized protein n=1 Tax=marine sediment metagenome TaxID=412755 RepID=X0Y9R4_9ZZZZ